jgi:hypothetical protein
LKNEKVFVYYFGGGVLRGAAGAGSLASNDNANSAANGTGASNTGTAQPGRGG